MISSGIPNISAVYVLSPLMYIFNKVLSTGTFPDRLKFSEVKPLYKKRWYNWIFNYHLISLLLSFSKIIENIIYKILHCYLNDNNILVKDQFGFREKLTTDTAMYALLNNVLLSLDKKKTCWWIILRFTKGVWLR